MIITKDLRPGNLIQDMGDGIGTVTGLYPNGDIETTASNLPLPPENYEGVPITEEWLGRCGFEDHDRYMTLQVGDQGVMLSYWKEDDYITLLDTQNNPIDHYRYVHQLQNLVQLFTGSELVIQAGSGAG